MILTVASGCDNVAWGGIDVTIESPSTLADTGRDSASVEEPEAPQPRLGPALLAGRRQGSEVRLSPVGMLLDDSLAPLPGPADSAAHAEALAMLDSGSEWVLFGAGARIGTLRVTETAQDPELCGLDRVLVGPPELLPDAANQERFLALSADYAEAWSAGEYAPLAHNYNQRVASLELGGAALPRVGARWPAEGMLGSRQDIQAFRPAEDATPSIAATFVVGDALDTSAPSTDAYALFLMARESPEGFEETYLWYRPAAEGKAVPRLVEHLDWDRDGRAEALLEVLGEGRRGYVGLERDDDGAWSEAYRSPCAHTSGTTER
ncbi:MAG: hypothetical protein U5R14_01540 [Gemmatimonadota bacterium]|nr:hypothetical protein [Gemmatimonadota bacterium]